MNKTDTNTQSNPSLAQKGDEIERAYWGHLSKLIPHYEMFWRDHVFPLRVPNQIWLRDRLDPQFEAVAIANYSTFVSLARARHKIFVKHENYKFVEEHYTALQRACELGIKLIQKFDDLYESLSHKHSGVAVASLEEFIGGRLDEYRNLLHDEMISTPKDEKKRRLIPKFDRINDYRNWSSVMYHLNRSDFVVAADQLKDDFRATCSRLEDAWKEMCKASGAIVGLKEYLRRRDEGIVVASVGNPLAASGTLIVRNTSN